MPAMVLTRADTLVTSFTFHWAKEVPWPTSHQRHRREKSQMARSDDRVQMYNSYTGRAARVAEQ